MLSDRAKMLIHKLAAVLLVLVLFVVVWAWRADAQECCPVSRVLAEVRAAKAQAPIYTQPSWPIVTRPASLPIYRPIGAYRLYYGHRGYIFEFTGLVIAGQPVYRRLP